MAFLSLILVTPKASTIVTTEGNPSGIAATAKATAVKNISKTPSPLIRPVANTTATIIPAARPKILPKESSWRCKGVGSGGVSCNIWAIRPSSVSMPVPTTTALARPPVTIVPIKTMFLRSPRGGSSSSISFRSFSTGTDSPVKAASFTLKEAASKSLASAGTESPASNMNMSPGTKSSTSICVTFPSLSTFTWALVISFKALSACSALFS